MIAINPVTLLMYQFLKVIILHANQLFGLLHSRIKVREKCHINLFFMVFNVFLMNCVKDTTIWVENNILASDKKQNDFSSRKDESLLLEING